MDWLEKIPNWIKIPLKILLPSLCLFSGFLLLISDGFANKLYLKDFRRQNGFAFGLIFIITLSLILVYVIFFASKPLIEKVKNYFLKKNLIKKFINMEDVYKQVLYEMYRTPSHSIKMDISRSEAAYLMNINAIGCGKSSAFGFIFDFYLQPWVIWGIEHETKIYEKIINNFERRQGKYKKKANYDLLKTNYEIAKQNINYIQSKTQEKK